MKFTDEELLFLKNRLKDSANEYLVFIYTQNLKSLLKRMKAGEKCLEAANQEGGIDSNLFKAWRKASGKSESEVG